MNSGPDPITPTQAREQRLLEAALALGTEAERRAFLASIADAAARRRLEELVAASAEADSFFSAPPIQNAAGEASAATASAPASEAPAQVIGRYKLLEVIGEGGFGEVWMAEQREPVKRRVALKIIKLGMDSRQIVARFEAERQALAMMDHPNIAKIHDAGTTDTGRPYFVMELVRGVKITEYCDQCQLPTPERLKLFIEVCKAVQHAHLKGVIHRDIKPSNILVTLHDGVPVPKVIDFGIAKATQQELTDKTVFTQFQQFIGTPAYISPEQAELSGLDIDTRADIYSLGVLLYELLVGQTPFDAREMMKGGLDALRRIIREREPQRPSTKLNTLMGEERTTAGKRRQTDVGKLAHQLQGDLDWIVMKCLEKDRTRRYETANGLAADLKRHLDNEPVVARPPSAAYKFQKAWRRNKLVFAAGTAVALALVVGVIGTTAGLVRSERQRHVAEAAQREESHQREIAVKALDGEKRQTAQADAAREERQAATYANDINLAQRAVAEQNLGQAWDLLDGQRPAPGRPERRGWEWRYLWEQCQSDALASPLVLSNQFNELTITPDGRWMVAAPVGPAEGGVVLLDVSDPRRLRLAEEITPKAGYARVAFSPNGELLAFSFLDGNPGPKEGRFTLRLWNARTRHIVGEAELGGRCFGLSFSPDGRQLLTYTGLWALENVMSVEVWEVAGLKRIANPPGVHYPSQKPASWGFAITRDWSALANREEEPDGSGRIQVVELTTGKQRWQSVPVGEINGLKFSPDGTILVADEGYDRAPRVRIWDAATGKEIGFGLNGHREMIMALAFWEDGKTLATASVDQTIRLWDVTDPAEPKAIGRPLRGHRSEVWGLALLPDQRTLVSVGKDGAFLTWDTQQARPDRTRLRLAFPKGLFSWQFTPDSKSILAVEDTGLVTRLSGPDFAIREELLKIGKVDWRNSAAFSKDGRFVARGSTNGMVQLWNLERRTLVKEFEGGTGRTAPFAFREDNQKLIVWSVDNQLTREWDLATFKQVSSWQDFRGPSLLSSDQRWYFTFGDSESAGQFLARDLVTGTQTIQTNLELRIESPGAWGISPNGNLLAVPSERGFVRLFDRATLRPIDTLRGFFVEAAFSVCFSPDGKRLAVSSGGREAMRFLDTERRLTLVSLEATGRSNFTDSQFSPDGNVVGAVARGIDNAIHLWRAPSWAEIEKAEAAVGKPQTP